MDDIESQSGTVIRTHAKLNATSMVTREVTTAIMTTATALMKASGHDSGGTGEGDNDDAVPVNQKCTRWMGAKEGQS